MRKADLKRMTVIDKASKIYQEAEKQTQYDHLQQICPQYVLHTKISQRGIWQQAGTIQVLMDPHIQDVPVFDKQQNTHLKQKLDCYKAEHPAYTVPLVKPSHRKTSFVFCSHIQGRLDLTLEAMPTT